MNTFYDVEKAKQVLATAYARNGHGANQVPLVKDVKLDSFAFKRVEYPPSVRLQASDGADGYEVVMKLFGVMCQSSLPPWTQRLRTPSVNRMRSIRQHVRITTFDMPEMHLALDRLNGIRDMLGQFLREELQGSLDFEPHEGHPCVEAHARYLSERKHMPNVKGEAFPFDVDPNNILSSMRADLFIRGPDNVVEYWKEQVDGDGRVRHSRLHPSTFKLGDVVEIAFSCVGVTVKDGKNGMILNLRAVTLVSDECRRESEIALTRLREPRLPTVTCLKRKRVHGVDEDQDGQGHRMAPSNPGNARLASTSMAGTVNGVRGGLDEGNGLGVAGEEQKAKAKAPKRGKTEESTQGLGGDGAVSGAREGDEGDNEEDVWQEEQDIEDEDPNFFRRGEAVEGMEVDDMYE